MTIGQKSFVGVQKIITLPGEIHPGVQGQHHHNHQRTQRTLYPQMRLPGGADQGNYVDDAQGE